MILKVFGSKMNLTLLLINNTKEINLQPIPDQNNFILEMLFWLENELRN